MMSLDVVVKVLAAFGTITLLYVGYGFFWRRSIRKLARDRFYRGHCVKCDADLRLNKQKCPRCGREISWLEAQIWEQALERRRQAESSSLQRPP